jgi:hypothetical protein
VALRAERPGAATTRALLQSALRWREGGTLPARQGGS